MNKIITRELNITAVALSIALVSGCSTVSSDQLSAVEAKVTSAVSDARKAASDAAAALKAAQGAQASADAAQASADAAKSTAEAAMTCCTENKDRIERMFEQTMKK